METLTKTLIGEGEYVGHVLTRKLPVKIDNALYSLIHFIGGMTTHDVINFADNATEDDLEELYELIVKFPSTIQEIMPMAGNYKVLRNSEHYQRIVGLIKMEDTEEEMIEEGTTNLNKLVWKKEPSKKHKKRIDLDWGVFKSFPIKKYMDITPPTNNSDEVMGELQLIDSLPPIDDFVRTTDDIHNHFSKFLKSKKLEYPKNEIKEILKNSSSILLKLKYHYNRPRPEQLAKEMGLKFHAKPLDSAKTPSYPSGHSAQGRLISRYLAEKYPKQEDELIRLGNEIGTGRLVAKVHYPSDDLFGKEIGDALYKSMGRKVVKEHVKVDKDGFYTTDTNPYFTRYFNPKYKEKLFKHWDSLGKASHDSLKLFGVDDAEWWSDDPGGFRNVPEIIYPLLALEWIGGVENTKFAKAGWDTTSEAGWYKLHFKVEPVGYDYMFDESENFGEQGYACWNIRVLIDKNSDFDPEGERVDSEIPYIQELFPESAQNKLSPYNNYTDEQYEVIELLWEYYHEEASEYWSQFCQVEVKLV